MTSDRERGYLLDNRAAGAGARFEGLAALFNAGTFRRIDWLGIEPGWRCWEVGAGGPSVPRWLSTKVGPLGRVVATDIDVSWVDATAAANIEVIRHDVVKDEPPGWGFDLVHARLVLVHLPGRIEALRRMVSAVRPGGWVVVEDFDLGLQPRGCIDESGPDQARANHIRRGFLELLVRRGVDPDYARTLPRLLRRAGLVDVGADGFLPVALAGASILERANIDQVRAELVEAGLATDEEIDLHLDAAAAGRLDLSTSLMISAWGRRR